MDIQQQIAATLIGSQVLPHIFPHESGAFVVSAAFERNRSTGIEPHEDSEYYDQFWVYPYYQADGRDEAWWEARKQYEALLEDETLYTAHIGVTLRSTDFAVR